MPWGGIAAAGLQGLGSAMSGGGERKLTPEEIERLRRRLFYAKKGFGKMQGMEDEMLGGVDMGEIAAATPLMAKNILPGMKRMLTRSAARFGLKSPRTTGNMQAAIAKAMSEKMAVLYGQALGDRYQRRRQVYGTRAGMAGL